MKKPPHRTGAANGEHDLAQARDALAGGTTLPFQRFDCRRRMEQASGPWSACWLPASQQWSFWES
jgi:hypothetical protein